MAFSAGTIGEVRSSATANNVNGGFFDSSLGGTDRSQSDTAHASGSDLASSNGTTNPSVVTSATYNFTSADHGNYIRIASGTNWTASWFRVVSTAGGAATLDRAVGTAASLTGGVWKLGGALSMNHASDATWAALLVAGNKVYYNGTLTLGASVTFAGTSGTNLPIIHEGYATARGDFPGVATMPTMACGTNIWTTGANSITRHINFSGSGSQVILISARNIFENCKVKNTSTSANQSAIGNNGSHTLIHKNEIICYNGYGIYSTSANYSIIDNYIHDCNIGIQPAAGDVANTGNNIIENRILGCITYGINIDSAHVVPMLIMRNTIVGFPTTKRGTGLNVTAGTNSKYIMGNIFYGLAVGVADANSNAVASYLDYNGFYNNTANFSGSGQSIGSHDLTTDPGFTSLGETSVTTATTSNTGNTITKTGATFVTDGVTAGRDYVYISTSPGGTVGLYGIVTVSSETQLVLDLAPGNSSNNVSAQIVRGRNLELGTNYKAQGYPGALIDSLSSAYFDIGALQIKIKTSTNPGAANVLSGTGYTIEDSSFTGTYHNLGSFDTLPTAKVESGYNYIADNVTLTGTLAVPTAAMGATGTVDLNNIKENIQYVMEQNNTTSGAPVMDLSDNLTRRVQKILKVNPTRIPQQPSYFPCITCWIDSKELQDQQISVRQSNQKRTALVKVNIAGIVSMNTATDAAMNQADEEIEYLMENVEMILRGYATLGNTVLWQVPGDVQYDSARIDEQTIIRAGVMTLNCKVLY